MKGVQNKSVRGKNCFHNFINNINKTKLDQYIQMT